MGTRHMIAVVNEGKCRVAQYGQWDGYPSGQGVCILDFLNNGNVEALRENSLKCSFVSDERYKELTSNYTDADAGEFFRKYPEFSRDTGADILSLIANSDFGLLLRNDYDFAADSLFCEWAYVIDFDKNTFEIYEGFNCKPLEKHERFFELSNSIRETAEDTYYPVRLKKMFSLFELPDEEEFLLECEPTDEAGGDTDG